MSEKKDRAERPEVEPEPPAELETDPEPTPDLPLVADEDGDDA